MKRNWHIKINNFLRLRKGSKGKMITYEERRTRKPVKAQIETKHVA